MEEIRKVAGGRMPTGAPPVRSQATGIHTNILPTGVCFTASQASTVQAWAKNVGGASGIAVGSAIAAFATDGLSVPLQAAGIGVTAYEMQEFGQYAAQQEATAGIDAYTALVNVFDYTIQTFNAVQSGVPFGWANESYQNACQYSGEYLYGT